MKQRCLACALQKDREIWEVYPYPEDGIVTDRPIDPMVTIDCQAKDDWRVVTVCHHCFHKLDPDQWISDRCWQSLNPVTPFDLLPKPE